MLWNGRRWPYRRSGGRAFRLGPGTARAAKSTMARTKRGCCRDRGAGRVAAGREIGGWLRASNHAFLVDAAGIAKSPSVPDALIS